MGFTSPIKFVGGKEIADYQFNAYIDIELLIVVCVY